VCRGRSFGECLTLVCVRVIFFSKGLISSICMIEGEKINVKYTEREREKEREREREMVRVFLCGGGTYR